MQLKIGNVRLDDTFYPGKDLYSDGHIEDELLDIVQTYKPCEYRKVIEERASWPILYHLSEFRHNIVDWLPIGREHKVLEVGSGCGAITGALARKAGEVTCIELSMKRSMINANRNKDCDNVSIHVGNFKDVETVLPCDYDYVMLIGVFEYAFGYMGGNQPYEDFIAVLKKHLKKGGRLVIAIENKFGMKYYAGCREDHSGRFFDGIEDYSKGGGTARTFSKGGLEKLLKGAGIEEYSFYYPYPDYKFPTTVFSDECLPKVGELYQNIRNFDRDRMLLFDEQQAFDAVIKEGMFSHYSNSYMIVTGEAPEIKYAKYSNDRDEKYAICTTLLSDGTKKWIEKKGTSEAAAAHVQNIYRFHNILKEQANVEKVEWNRCEKPLKNADGADYIELEYVEGITLEEELDLLAAAGRKEEFLSLFERFCRLAKACESGAYTDYDLIFQNIMVRQEEWTIIDYEWTFERQCSAAELIARAVHCYGADRAGRAEFCQWMIAHCKAASMDVEAELEKVAEREAEFQKYVQGDFMALSRLRHAIGNPAYSLEYIEERIGAGAPRIQIYEDTGKGYSEENSYFATDYTRDGQVVTFSVDIRPELVNLRIDPANQPCYVSVLSAKLEGEEVLPKLLHAAKGMKRYHNGAGLKDGRYVFATEDPHFEWKVKGLGKENTGKLVIQMKLENMSLEVASAVCEAMGLKGKVLW